MYRPTPQTVGLINFHLLWVNLGVLQWEWGGTAKLDPLTHIWGLTGAFSDEISNGTTTSLVGWVGILDTHSDNCPNGPNPRGHDYPGR
jgi:hypothetical protein